MDYRTIMRRYDYENHFLNMVSSGNVKQVLEAFLEMEKGGRSEDKGMIYMNNPQVSTSILRTLIRKAAEKSGLSPIIIDEITERHAQISITCRNTA
ncbi:MAG: AraC family transcriptional regulator, partial [Lachnospiraceae bacterium]|nr:AraC family transcriptional regulator [Lachnospiraceae bacterium]